MHGDRRKTSIEWPTVVDDRLRLLVALAEATNAVSPSSAAELLAAMVCAQPFDGGQLAAAVLDYRRLPPDKIDADTRRHSPPTTQPARRGRPRARRVTPGNRGRTS